MSIIKPAPAAARSDHPAAVQHPGGKGRGPAKKHLGIHLFLIVMAAMWLVPLAWTIFTSLRPKADTDKYGYFSLGGSFNFDNFTEAWTRGGFAQYAWNSALITIPSVILILFFASMMAFAVSRVAWKFNVTLLIMFTAGNLLPPQVLAAPLFQMFKQLELPYSVSDSGNLLNTYISVIAVDTAFQIGFVTFVLSNYMKALSPELTEAALVDGAGIWRQYWEIILPLCLARPSRDGHAAGHLHLQRLLLAAAVHSKRGPAPAHHRREQPSGPVPLGLQPDRRGAMITAIPALIIYLLLQRHFVAGLTLGSSKG
ncbi:carbohydrate ABC transporter permease [Pseudarthrobacter sp. So.54]